MLIADAHTHTNPVKGLGMSRIAPKFKEGGGWFMAIVGLSPWHYSLEPTLEGYEKTLKMILKEAEVARSYGLKVRTFFGFHPADVDHLMGRMKPEEVLEFGLKVLDVVERYVKEGMLDGVGEVGRQHYKTTPVSVVISEMIMERAFEIVKDYAVPVHLHLEQGGEVTARDVERRIVKNSLPREKVIVHHARGKSLVAAVNHDLVATVPGVLGSLEKAFQLEPKYMVESDHIDDPKRPGVVVYPWEIAKNVNELLRRGIVDEEYIMKIMVDNVVKTFSVEPP